MIFTAAALSLLMAGTPRKFVEVRQEVQVEYDYSPSVGREPEPEPEAFVPVRYLTPEQRAQPVIVEPEPVVVYPGDEEASNAAPPQQQTGAPFNMEDFADAARNAAGIANGYAGQMPDYITSMGSGSATGSNAIPDYGVSDE